MQRVIMSMTTAECWELGSLDFPLLKKGQQTLHQYLIIIPIDQYFQQMGL